MNCFKSAVAFFFLFFLHGFSIGNGQQGITHNGYGIAEGRDLIDKSFKLAQMLNRITNDCLTENALLLAIPC